MSRTAKPISRRKLIGCVLLLLGAFLAWRWFAGTDKTYLDRAHFAAPDGQRDFIMIYKRDGLDISRLLFVRDAPPRQEPLIALGRINEPSLVVWSSDGTVGALAIISGSQRIYDQAYDFRLSQHIHEADGADETSTQRHQRISALLKNRGGAAAPAARQNHEIGGDEQEKWRAIDPEK